MFPRLDEAHELKWDPAKATPSTKPAITARVREPINTQNMERGPVAWRASVVVSLVGRS